MECGGVHANAPGAQLERVGRLAHEPLRPPWRVVDLRGDARLSHAALDLRTVGRRDRADLDPPAPSRASARSPRPSGDTIQTGELNPGGGVVSPTAATKRPPPGTEASASAARNNHRGGRWRSSGW